MALLPLGAAGFFLLAGYELCRSVSSSLFVEAYGADNLPWVMGGSPLALALMVYGYGLVLSRLKPWRTFLATKAFFFLLFLVFYALLQAGIKPAAAAFYIFREAYIMLIVEQCWSFVNSRVPQAQAKKVYGAFLAATGAGAILGSYMVKTLVQTLGSQTLILVAALALIPSAALSALAFRMAGEPPAPPVPVGDPLGLKAVLKSRLLLIMAGLVLVTQAAGALLEIRWNKLVEGAFPADAGQLDARSAYFAGFWLTINIVSTAVQFLGPPLVLAFLSTRGALRAVPLVHLGLVTALILAPGLALGAAAFGSFKVLDYSLHRAAKEMLYIPLGFEARYRAKELLDAFGYRAAKAGISLSLIPLKASGLLGPSGYAGAALGFVLAWLGLTVALPAEKEPN